MNLNKFKKISLGVSLVIFGLFILVNITMAAKWSKIFTLKRLTPAVPLVTTPLPEVKPPVQIPQADEVGWSTGEIPTLPTPPPPPPPVAPVPTKGIFETIGDFFKSEPPSPAPAPEPTPVVTTPDGSKGNDLFKPVAGTPEFTAEINASNIDAAAKAAIDKACAENPVLQTVTTSFVMYFDKTGQIVLVPDRKDASQPIITITVTGNCNDNKISNIDIKGEKLTPETLKIFTKTNEVLKNAITADSGGQAGGKTDKRGDAVDAPAKTDLPQGASIPSCIGKTARTYDIEIFVPTKNKAGDFSNPSLKPIPGNGVGTPLGYRRVVIGTYVCKKGIMGVTDIKLIPPIKTQPEKEADQNHGRIADPQETITTPNGGDQILNKTAPPPAPVITTPTPPPAPPAPVGIFEAVSNFFKPAPPPEPEPTVTTLDGSKRAPGSDLFKPAGGSADKQGGASSPANMGFPSIIDPKTIKKLCEGKKDGYTGSVEVRVPNSNAKGDFSNAIPVSPVIKDTRVVKFYYICQDGTPLPDNDSDRKARSAPSKSPVVEQPPITEPPKTVDSGSKTTSNDEILSKEECEKLKIYAQRRAGALRSAEKTAADLAADPTTPTADSAEIKKTVADLKEKVKNDDAMLKKCAEAEANSKNQGRVATPQKTITTPSGGDNQIFNKPAQQNRIFENVTPAPQDRTFYQNDTSEEALTTPQPDSAYRDYYPDTSTAPSYDEKTPWWKKVYDFFTPDIAPATESPAQRG